MSLHLQRYMQHLIKAKENQAGETQLDEGALDRFAKKVADKSYGQLNNRMKEVTGRTNVSPLDTDKTDVNKLGNDRRYREMNSRYSQASLDPKFMLKTAKEKAKTLGFKVEELEAAGFNDSEIDNLLEIYGAKATAALRKQAKGSGPVAKGAQRLRKDQVDQYKKRKKQKADAADVRKEIRQGGGD